MAKLSVYLATLLLGSNFSASTLPASGGFASGKTAVAARSTMPESTPRAVTSLSARGRLCTDQEQRSIDLVNRERRARGLCVLSVNPLLVQVAREHSREMWEKGYFDHFSPTPGLRTPMERYLARLGHTPSWAFLGENLFYCSIVDPDRGHRCLMASPKHRENILNERFREIGVGCFTAPDGQFYLTQLFLAQTD
ncbi:MAG: CAP domain-containing protein [Armatimonadota bacterium]